MRACAVILTIHLKMQWNLWKVSNQLVCLITSSSFLNYISALQQWCYLQSIRLMFRLTFGTQSQWFFTPLLLALRFSYALWYFLKAPVSCQRSFFISGGTSSLKHVAGGKKLCWKHPQSRKQWWWWEETDIRLPMFSLTTNCKRDAFQCSYSR